MFVSGLSPELEELMVEGFLLQVTLPETQQLYRSLLIKLDPRHHHHTDSPFPQDSAEQDQHQHNSQGGSPPHNQVTYYNFKAELR